MTFQSHFAVFRNLTSRCGLQKSSMTSSNLRLVGATNMHTAPCRLLLNSRPCPVLPHIGLTRHNQPQCFRTKTGPAAVAFKVATETKVQDVKDFSEIPGPKPLPLMGIVLQTITHRDFNPKDQFKVFEGFIKDYGPIVKLFSLQKTPFVISTNADDVELLFKTTMENPVRYGMLSLKQVRRAEKDNYFNTSTGLFAEQGAEWWRLRSRVQVPLMRPHNMTMYLPRVDSATIKFMDRIDEFQTKTGQVHPDFIQELYKWAMECTCLVALNREMGCLDPDIAPDSVPMQLIKNINIMFSALNDTEYGLHMWKYFRTPAYVRLERSHAAMLETAKEAIEEAEASLEEAKTQRDPDRRLTIMETFLNTEGLARSDVATVILDLLCGGIDTTSHTMGFALYLLSRNPDTQRRLQQEVDAVVKRDEPLTSEHLAALDCIGHVVKETLRLYPITFGHARVLLKDVVMSGYRVPAKTLFIGMSSLTCKMEKYFPRPLEFLPERWQRDRPYGEIHPFASLPFSHGTRMCIGKRIAEQQLYTCLIRLLQKYTVTFESDEEMRTKLRFVLKPDMSLRFKFHPRDSVY